MYAETGLLVPCFQNFSPETLHFDDFYRTHNKPNPYLSNLVSEYDPGAESDLFKAPEPILEEPITGLFGEDVIECLQGDQLLSEIFYECRKDLLAKAAIEISPPEVLDMKLPLMPPIDENESEERLPCDVFQKSLSSECLSSLISTPCFMEFEAADFGAGYGMRRAFSEGDIKSLGPVNSSQLLQPSIAISNCSAEERREKLSRYREKKTKRNFGRKIKYACRKALADTQPRIRGRFAKTEETEARK